MQLLLIILPIFLIIGAGYLFRRVGVVDESWVHVLSGFVYSVALPALIISSFWKLDWQDPDLPRVAGVGLISVLAVAVLLFLFLKYAVRTDGKTKAAIFLSALVGNCIYMGFPIGQSAFGPQWFSEVATLGTLFLVVGTLISISASSYFAGESHKTTERILDFFKNPLFLSLVVGFVLGIFHVRGIVADLLQAPLSMVGATASPLALFGLGAFLYRTFQPVERKYLFGAVAAKLLLFPVVAFFSVFIGRLEYGYAGIFALLGAMPTAVTTFVVAEKFDLNKEFVNEALLATTVLSIGVIPLVLSLFL